MKTIIPYGRQSVTEKDILAVADVLKSDYLTQGPEGPRFEKEISENVEVKYAVAVNSGTSALHIACLALGLNSDDWLWTTPISFVASANCGLYCGAKVDFVDIDPDSWNMSIELLNEKLIRSRLTGTLPKVIVVVHLCGLPCEMEEFYKLSQEFGFRIIEDACHALGSKYKNLPVGNCYYSDITVFSFHPVKAMTTGEGGMATTNNIALAEKMRLLRSHGITRDPQSMTQEVDGPWSYQQIALGFNYRMTEIQAALGTSQLTRLAESIVRRRELSDLYNSLLVDLPLKRQFERDGCYSAKHLYVIRIKGGGRGSSHRQVFDYLRENGIGVNLHYIPIHTQPYFNSLGFEKGMFPNAEHYYKEAITLPMYASLSEENVYRVTALLAECLG